MSWPPFLLKLRFKNSEHSFALWLPIFLVGPVCLAFLLAVVLILLPFAILTVIFTWEPGWLRFELLFVPSMLRLLSQLRGLLFDVDGSKGHVYIEFV